MAKLGFLLTIFKFIAGLLLLPLVYALVISLGTELSKLSSTNLTYFYSGIICYLVLHLFIFRPTPIYEKGKEIAGKGSEATSSFLQVAPHILPIFSLIVFAIYFLFSLFVNKHDLINYFLLVFSFSATLHLVLTADEMRNSKEGNNAIVDYLFGFSLIFIINIFLIGLLLSLVVKEFAFLEFTKSVFSVTKTFYSAVFNQLFG